MSTSPEVVVHHDGPITIIRINRPAVRNAINKATADALRAAWQAFDADETARVGVLTGGENIFCAGADLTALNELTPALLDENGPLGFTRLAVSKPTIAAIAGYCVAGGLEIACWCDLRIADETAIFGCFERRFGVPLIDGGTQRLPHIVGLGRALELIMTGRAVSAPEALAIGLANEVVPPGKSLERAIEIGKILATFPQAALRNDRQAVYQGLGKTLPAGLRREAELGRETLLSQEFSEGVRRFQSGEGRKGNFSS